MKTNEITIIAMFISMMAITAGISIPTGIGVSITLQTFFVMLIGLMLKPKIAISIIFGYLLVGIVGVPVFSGYTSGIGAIISSSGGFLISFLFAVSFISISKQFLKEGIVHEIILGVIGTIIIYLIGVIYMSIIIEVNIVTVFLWMQVYFIGDLIKIFASAIVSIRLKERLKNIDIAKDCFNK